MRLLQPAVVCFEKVAGFRTSPHYKAFLRQLSLAGFRLYSETHDLREPSFASRRRWLAIALNTLYVKDPDMPLVGPDNFKRPLVFDPKVHALAYLTDTHKHELAVTADEMVIFRHYQDSAKVVEAGSIYPTVTASYRASLGFLKEVLSDKASSRGSLTWAMLRLDGAHPSRRLELWAFPMVRSCQRIRSWQCAS